MACSSTPEAELPGGEGASTRGTQKEMELLKDLPSYHSDNFSKYSQGSWNNSQAFGKPYLRLKDIPEDKRGVEIRNDQTSLLLRDLEKSALKNSRVTLKRSSSVEDTSRKVPRLDYDSDSSPTSSFTSSYSYSVTFTLS